MNCCDPPATVDLGTTDAERDLAVRGFVALWQGQRPRPDDLYAESGTVEALQRRGLIVLDDHGRIAGIHGLSTTPTAHHITHAAGTIPTWCAFDAIGIPAALGIDAHAHTICPTCGRHLEVAVTAGRPAADPDLRLWLPTTECAHVLDDLCAHANLYCNHEHLAANLSPSATGSILTVVEGARLGTTTWSEAATALRPA